jgi:hypothetical protein
MEKIQLKIIGMSYSQAQTGAYALILGEVNGDRRIPIVIGGFEAQAIAIELENMKPARPLTHDLFKNFATSFQIKLNEVIINKFQEGIFYSLLVCSDKGGNVIKIDSRTSDAVALGLRFGCPIYTYPEIINKAGVSMEEVEREETPPETDESEEISAMPEADDLRAYSISELKKMISEAIEKEDYEKASVIQKEINKRTGK